MIWNFLTRKRISSPSPSKFRSQYGVATRGGSVRLAQLIIICIVLSNSIQIGLFLAKWAMLWAAVAYLFEIHCHMERNGGNRFALVTFHRLAPH